MSDKKDYIQTLISNNKIVLFMKGTPIKPACGFSLRAVSILRACGIKEGRFLAINVLDDDELRSGIKAFSHWPTIPQLYIDSQFIGGVDIMSELFDSGELRNILQEYQ